MPNHIHFIVEILNSDGNVVYGFKSTMKSPSRTLGTIVRGFKVPLHDKSVDRYGNVIITRQ